MKSIYLVVAFSLFSWLASTAQNASIEGYVRQSDNTTALSDISIHLSKKKLGTSTNGNGYYKLENIPTGDYTLIASAIGYLSQKVEISITTTESMRIDFILEESIISLPEVSVTRGKIGIKDIPGSVHYISPKDLENFNYTDINRILREVPGVNIQEEDGFGLFPNIGLRGTGVQRNTKITVMEDGILIAPAPYVAPAAYYFPTMGRMQGVEIVKGSSQIKYGPYTTGGAINLISTQIPHDFEGNISLSGGSFGARNLHATIGNSHKNFAYLVEAFQYQAEGFKELDGAKNRGLARNSGFVKQDYHAKFRANTNINAKVYQSLTFKIAQASGDINETYLGLTQEDFSVNSNRRYAGSQIDNIQTDQTQFALTYKAIFSNNFNLTTVAYRTNFGRNWYKLDKIKGTEGEKIKIATLLDNPSIYPEEFGTITGTSSVNDDALFVKANNRSYYSKGVQSTIKYNFETEKVHHNFDLGFRIHQDQIDRFQWTDQYAMDDGLMNLTESGIHGTESNSIETADAIAAYIQYKLGIGKFTATPGIRYETIYSERLNYGQSDPARIGSDLSKRSRYINILLPGIGLDYNYNNHLSTFVGIHKGFAPPGSKEALEPEVSINYELGTRYSKNGLSSQAVLFFNSYKNLLGADLEAAGGGGTNEQFNGGAVQTKGLEFNATYDILFSKKQSKYSLPLSITYTYTDATFQNNFDSDFGGWGKVAAGDQFPYLANNQFAIILGVEHHKFDFNLSGRYTDVMRTEPGQGEIPTNEKTDSYFVIDVSANYNVSKIVSFFVNTTNLTNQVYIVARRPAGLRPGLPRAFNIGLRANF